MNNKTNNNDFRIELITNTHPKLSQHIIISDTEVIRMNKLKEVSEKLAKRIK